MQWINHMRTVYKFANTNHSIAQGKVKEWTASAQKGDKACFEVVFESLCRQDFTRFFFKDFQVLTEQVLVWLEAFSNPLKNWPFFNLITRKRSAIITKRN